MLQFFIHPDYDGFVQNDIGLMYLETPLTFNEFVSPICLPNGDEPPPGQSCYVTGFGVQCK